MTRQCWAIRPWRASHVRPELDAACDPLVLDDGAAARRAGKLRDADVVAVLDGPDALQRFEVAGARNRIGQLPGELAGRCRVGGEPAEEIQRDAERLGGGRQPGDRQVGAAVLDHRDQRTRVVGAGGELELRQPPHFRAFSRRFPKVFAAPPSKDSKSLQDPGFIKKSPNYPPFYQPIRSGCQRTFTAVLGPTGTALSPDADPSSRSRRPSVDPQHPLRPAPVLAANTVVNFGQWPLVATS